MFKMIFETFITDLRDALLRGGYSKRKLQITTCHHQPPLITLFGSVYQTFVRLSSFLQFTAYTHKGRYKGYLGNQFAIYINVE